MRMTRWWSTAAGLALTLAACSGSPAASPGTTVDQPQESDDVPVGQLLTGTITVTFHNVQTGPGASTTEDDQLRLEVRLRSSEDGPTSWVDAGSTYSYTGSFVDHAAQAEIPHCVKDNYDDATGSGAVGSGLTIYGGPNGNEMQLTVSVVAHATGHNQTVCDIGPVDILTGDTSDDTTVGFGCPSGQLDATGAMSTGYDFSCTVRSAIGEGQTIVTGMVGPP